MYYQDMRYTLLKQVKAYPLTSAIGTFERYDASLSWFNKGILDLYSNQYGSGRSITC